MMGRFDVIKLCNGVHCHMLGLGTWRAKGEECYNAVKEAIKIGYRHIDTAHYYENEKEVGLAIRDAMKDFEINRKELFVVTKLATTCNQPHLVVPSLKESLTRLGLTYVDLYLIHSPVCPQPVDDIVTLENMKTSDGKTLFLDIPPIDVWKSMEKCVELGLASSIGVSNFNSMQIQSILDCCIIKPVTNQVECHQYLQQDKLREFCDKHNIILTAFRPFGGQVPKPTDPSLLTNPVIIKIAEKHGKTVGQILLRWHIQKSQIVLFKSINPKRIIDNANIFDFTLTEDDMLDIQKLEMNHRYCPFLDNVSSPQYPFHADF